MSDLGLLSAVLLAIERAVGKENVTIVRPWAAADDFAYFAAEAPAFFFHLGTVKRGTKSGNNHTPTFMADAGASPVGMRVISNVLLDYLTPHNDRLQPDRGPHAVLKERER